jgi:hypothetical protein
MRRIFIGLVGVAVLASVGFAQSSNPFKTYKNQEDYCRENPKMPTCIKTGPLNLDSINGGLYRPAAPSQSSSPAPRHPAAVQPRMSAPGPMTEVALEDWRFSHPAPAMLISVNLVSLLGSPLCGTLLSGAADFTPADLDRTRRVLSDVGQLLVSVSPTASGKPSVLMLAKGNLDGPLGGLLRSGAGMQTQRLDAITMLIGDARSLEMTGHRMRSTMVRTSFNALQTAATEEGLKYDAWIGIDPRHLAALASAFGGGSSAQSLGMLSNLRGISVGLYLRDQLRMEAVLDTPSPDIAERMLVAYRQAEAKQRAGKDPGQVWVNTEGSKVRFVEIVDAKDIKNAEILDPEMTRMFKPYLSSLTQSLAQLSTAPAQAQAKPKASPGVIVIQGLDKK